MLDLASFFPVSLHDFVYITSPFGSFCGLSIKIAWLLKWKWSWWSGFPRPHRTRKLWDLLKVKARNWLALFVNTITQVRASLDWRRRALHESVLIEIVNNGRHDSLESSSVPCVPWWFAFLPLVKYIHLLPWTFKHLIASVLRVRPEILNFFV